MNLELKAVYYCYTNKMKWGKALTIDEAIKNAGVKKTDKLCKYVVMAAVYNNPTDAELENLMDCIIPNQVYGSPNYYHNRSKKDDKMINRLHVGWITIIDKSK